uniref:Translocon-associated protein subunit delta n=1 Tax=Macrostomum lignano TaxID=282301 RepID=A0A1I8G2A7_9PLAT
MRFNIELFVRILILQLTLTRSALTDAVVNGALNEREDVRVQFYMLQLDQWTSAGLEAKFKATLAQALTGYCMGNFTICGFNSSSFENFTAASVRFSPGYPANVDSHYLNLRLSIAYSLQQPGENEINFILPVADTTTIIENNRMKLYDAIGHYIVYIDAQFAQFYSIPPPHFINLVVVSAAVGFTLLLTVVALTMRKCA